MQERYIIGIDQSTQGTKAILVNSLGNIVDKTYLTHKQIISDEGWVSHDGEEIFRNTVSAVCSLIEHSAVEKQDVAAIGITNQRETTVAWDRMTGRAIAPAVVWQCARGKEITDRLFDGKTEHEIRKKTGIPLSPYFPAAKAGWILKHIPEARQLADQNRLCIGTVDSWLVFRLTEGKVFKTDYSNASRTQLFDLHTLSWDEKLCDIFGIPVQALATVTNSDGDYGTTTLDGYFDRPVPICGVLGDSHAALFGQGCTMPGMTKATYGTGSSVMMNIGRSFRESKSGLVTSLAWGIGGKVDYVLEGNINYSGAVITWMQNDLGLIRSADETSRLASSANKSDTTYLVPAFSGLGAPYWKDDAQAVFCGMSRTTARAELVKAGLECIGYQVTDIVKAMSKDAGVPLSELRVDGGPTKNEYLMQFQSDMANAAVSIPQVEELSAVGAAYMAGIAAGIFDMDILQTMQRKRIFKPVMDTETRTEKYNGWKKAVEMVIK